MQTMSDVASGATSVAEDIFGIVDSVLNSISGTKSITGTLVRGISNTKDIGTIIDGIQNYLELAAKIAQTVGDVTGLVGNIGSSAGGFDAGASSAIAMVSMISSVVSSVISGINAGIDLVQEGTKIIGKYVGRAALSVLGLSGLNGDIKFLLDTQEGVLKAYSSNNPEMKTNLDMIGKNRAAGRSAQVNNQLNIYGSPGMSAGDLMDHSMWQVRTAGVGVFGYGSS
jgi:phage-related protein